MTQLLYGEDGFFHPFPTDTLIPDLMLSSQFYEYPVRELNSAPRLEGPMT